MARTNGPIQVWHRTDTIPSDAEGGYAGGDSTAAAVGGAMAQAGQAVATVGNLSATATALPAGASPTVAVTGVIPNKVINIGVPRGADGAPGMGYEEGQQLLAQNQTTLTAAQAAQGAAASSASDAADAVTLAQQAQAAALEVPDDNVSALVGNPVTLTRAALDADFAAIPNNGQRAVGKGELVVNISDFGAVGNGSTDDAPAIQAALDYAAANSLPVTAPKGSIYRIDSGIEIAGPADFWDVTFAYRGNGTAVRLNGPIRQQWRIGRVVNAQKTIAGFSEVAGSIGVEIYDQSKSLVEIKSVTRFETGVRLFGDTVGVAYNTIHLSELTTNLVNMRLDHGATGWVNANTIIGGSWQHTPRVVIDPPQDRAPGSRHVLIADGDRPGNQNTFIGCSFEGSTAEYMIECHGPMNSFTDCRWESINPHVLWGPRSYGNVIRDGYKPWKIIAENNATESTGKTHYGNAITWPAAGYVQEIHVPASAMVIAEGSGSVGAWRRRPAALVKVADSDVITMNVRLPSNWDTFDAIVHYTNGGGTTGTVAWLLRSVSESDGTSMGTPTGGVTTTTTAPTLASRRVARIGMAIPARPARDMFTTEVDERALTLNLIPAASSTFTDTIIVLGLTLRRHT